MSWREDASAIWRGPEVFLREGGAGGGKERFRDTSDEFEVVKVSAFKSATGESGWM